VFDFEKLILVLQKEKWKKLVYEQPHFVCQVWKHHLENVKFFTLEKSEFSLTPWCSFVNAKDEMFCILFLSVIETGLLDLPKIEAKASLSAIYHW